MLRQSSQRLCAATPVKAALTNALPFTQALLGGRLSEARIDSHFFDAATSAAAGAATPAAGQQQQLQRAPSSFDQTYARSLATLRAAYTGNVNDAAGLVDPTVRPLLTTFSASGALGFARDQLTALKDSRVVDVTAALAERNIVFASPDAIPASAQLSVDERGTMLKPAPGAPFTTVPVVIDPSQLKDATTCRAIIAAPRGSVDPANSDWCLLLVELPFVAAATSAAAATATHGSSATVAHLQIPEGGVKVLKTFAAGPQVKTAVARATTAARVTMAAEATAALQVLLDQLVQHTTTAVEYGRVLADSELVQQRLSVLASAIYALESAGSIVEGALAANPAAASAGAEDGALLALATHVLLSQHVSQALKILGPSSVFAAESASTPRRFQYLRHLALASTAMPRAFGVPVSAAAIAVANAIPSAVPVVDMNPIEATFRGRTQFSQQRAHRDFPVNMNLRLPVTQLSEDSIAFRKAIIQAKLLKPGQVEPFANVAMELFVSTCASFRSSNVVDRDDVGGYTDVLKSTVFLEDSSVRRRQQLSIAKIMDTKDATTLLSALTATPRKPIATPPSELPAVKDDKPKSSSAQKPASSATPSATPGADGATSAAGTAGDKKQ
jgi:hypothetical protein